MEINVILNRSRVPLSRLEHLARETKVLATKTIPYDEKRLSSVENQTVVQRAIVSKIPFKSDMPIEYQIEDYGKKGLNLILVGSKKYNSRDLK